MGAAITAVLAILCWAALELTHQLAGPAWAAWVSGGAQYQWLGYSWGGLGVPLVMLMYESFAKHRVS